MNSEEQARVFEAKDQPVEAAQAYEDLIASAQANLDTYLNLAVLYFECMDFGYLAHHKLSDSFIKLAWERRTELLKDAERRFGWHPEIEFWRRYFSYIYGGEAPFFDACERFVKTGETLVPYLHLVCAPAGERYRQQAEELLKSVRAGRTVKERYIKSVVESALRAARRRAETSR